MVLPEEGADVALVDILPEVEDVAVEIEKKGRCSVAAVFDIADPEQVQSGVDRIKQSLSDIDILVNNAGIVNNIAALTKMSFDAWKGS